MSTKRPQTLTPDNIQELVHAELKKVPDKYVVCTDCKRSGGRARLSIDGAQFDLTVRIFDGTLPNWHAQPVATARFNDSFGTVRWPDRLDTLRKEIQRLTDTQ